MHEAIMHEISRHSRLILPCFVDIFRDRFLIDDLFMIYTFASTKMLSRKYFTNISQLIFFELIFLIIDILCTICNCIYETSKFIVPR